MVFSPPWGARAGCSGKLSVTPRIAAQTLRVWDELLVALMLVEILHTVRISICSHLLVTEPFLVIGLIGLRAPRIVERPLTPPPENVPVDRN